MKRDLFFSYFEENIFKKRRKQTDRQADRKTTVNGKSSAELN